MLLQRTRFCSFLWLKIVFLYNKVDNKCIFVFQKSYVSHLGHLLYEFVGLAPWEVLMRRLACFIHWEPPGAYRMVGVQLSGRGPCANGYLEGNFCSQILSPSFQYAKVLLCPALTRPPCVLSASHSLWEQRMK